VRLPLANVVGGLNNGWNTAMSTFAFERGTASLALQVLLMYKVEALLEACSPEEAALRETLVQLRADAAALRAMSYRFALENEHAVPGAEGSIIRLYFAELNQKVANASIKLHGISAPEVIAHHGWAYHYFEAFSETIAGGTAEIQRDVIAERVLGLPRGAR
jgi:alkylation response protein AidB-like acyl-CoA dehydrogenase